MQASYWRPGPSGDYPFPGTVNFIKEFFMAKSAKKANHDETIIAQAVAQVCGREAASGQPIPPSGEIDLTAHPLPQDFGTFAGVKKVITTIPARKPNNQAYFRIHPDEEWQQRGLVLQLKEDGEFYYVLPSLGYELAQEARAKMLYAYITRDGNVGIWPINMPGDDGRLDNWSQSAHTAATMAQTQWVRLVANRAVGAYDVMTASLADGRHGSGQPSPLAVLAIAIPPNPREAKVNTRLTAFALFLSTNHAFPSARGFTQPGPCIFETTASPAFRFF